MGLSRGWGGAMSMIDGILLVLEKTQGLVGSVCICGSTLCKERKFFFCFVFNQTLQELQRNQHEYKYKKR